MCIVQLGYCRRRYALIQLVAIGPSFIGQTSHKQISKRLEESMLNGKNTDNFTDNFTLGTNSMCATSCANKILFSALLYLTNLCCSVSAGTIDHVQIAKASMGLVEAYTCRSNLT